MSKPFNLADAKAGHPVAIANAIPGAAGLNNTVPAKILTADLNNAWRVVVSYFHGEDERVVKFLADGTNPKGEENINTRAHLVMGPIGTIDGKPVYPGDMITLGGLAFHAPYDVPVPSEAKWPRQYPETQMPGVDLCIVYASFNGDQYESLFAVANAAIRHGIDNGYLLDPTQAAKEISDAIATLSDEYERRYAIAKRDRERAIMRAGVDVGWNQQLPMHVPRGLACPRSDAQVDALIAKVK